MFTPQERDRLREELISTARNDQRIAAVALTGSAALGTEDQWSDIDLAFGISAEADLQPVIADWTVRMYRAHSAIHHFDVPRGATVYRVFLLSNTLQVDLAFSPAREFGAIAPSFKLLYGTAEPQIRPPTRNAAQLIGMGWLYSLHARSSIARGRVWQAEYMISGVRDHVLALACLRHGLPAAEGRGMDLLPQDITAAMSKTLVCSLSVRELSRAFLAVIECLILEINQVDASLANRLASPLRELADRPDP